jgi:hypothetical protein
MTIRAWVIAPWSSTTRVGAPTNELTLPTGLASDDIANTSAANIPPGINVGAWRVDNLASKAALDTLDATPGVIVLSAINDDGTKVTGYLRPQDSPTGPQLVAAKTRLQNAGIPTAFLTANVTVGMTLAQIADVLRAWAHDLLKG